MPADEMVDIMLKSRSRNRTVGGRGAENGMSLKILFAAVEVAPFAKVGGLADVAGSLPQALRELGHDVRVVMPAYRMALDDPKHAIRPSISNFRVSLNSWWHKHASLHETRHQSVPVYFLGTDEWFNEVSKSEQVYSPGVDAYLFFARAVLECCKQLDWIPDVIHCHDWHTGFIPVLMREQHNDFFSETATCYTIHNLAYQGEFGIETLDKVGLSRDLYNFRELETFGSVNFLKAGCAFSDQVNTVSETYAREIQQAEFGCRLEGLMQHLAQEGRLSGILNGIDQEEWNPATDLRIAENFDADHPSGKAACREALLQKLGWEPIDGAPIAGVVSRLSSQKGMNLILDVAERLTELPVQLVVQGLGDPWLADRFTELERKYPKHFRFAQRFDVDLAQAIYAGSDLFFMPSAFEPCGLGQLIALRYGTIPVVRKTGGLADTVFEGENGFVFENKSADEFLSAVRRAHEAFANSMAWGQMVDRALRQDHGWGKSAGQYVAMYERALSARRKTALAS
jgi:starch synthase